MWEGSGARPQLGYASLIGLCSKYGAAQWRLKQEANWAAGEAAAKAGTAGESAGAGAAAQLSKPMPDSKEVRSLYVQQARHR